MAKSFRALSLAFVLVLVPLAPLAHGQQLTEADNAANIKAEVSKRIERDKNRVKVKLRAGNEIKGRLSRADENSFIITEDKTSKQLELAYSDVVSVKGRGMSTTNKVLIFGGIAVATIAIIGVIAVKSIDPFENGILR